MTRQKTTRRQKNISRLLRERMLSYSDKLKSARRNAEEKKGFRG